MTTSTTPRAIRLKPKENLLEIDWGDGHGCRYDGGYLRWTCPCAGCRGHGPGQVVPPSWAQCKDVRVTNAAAVGAYALRFDFTDGHASGIYSYDWLRDACPDTREGLDDRGRPLAAP